MIYEILVRPSYSKRMTSDHLVWIESDLPTRSFEKWLCEQSLLDASGRSAIVRWSIVQSQKPAHFKLATQAKALVNRIAELMLGSTDAISIPSAVVPAKKQALALA
jgi:hypothetical protein